MGPLYKSVVYKDSEPFVMDVESRDMLKFCIMEYSTDNQNKLICIKIIR